MNRLLLDFYDNIGKKVQFWLPVLIIAFSAFGFSIFNRTISWDDLLQEHFFEQALLGRWGMNVWTILIGSLRVMPFTYKWLSFMFLLLASFLLSSVFYHINSRNGSVWYYTVFASVFVSYPLINEIWEFIGANVMVTGNMCFVTLAFLVLLVNEKQFSPKPYTIAVLLLILPVSSYESSVFVYISLICIYILFYYGLKCNYLSFKKWIRLNVYYMLPILIAYVIRLVVCQIICLVVGRAPHNLGDTAFLWGTNSFMVILKGVIKEWIYNYVVNGLVYFPISIFVFSFLVFMCYIVYKSIYHKHFSILFFGFVSFFSLFVLMFVQGKIQPYRTSQSISLFIAFVAFLVCSRSKNIKINKILIMIMLLFSWYQSVYLNKMLSLNNLRSNNEAAVIRNMGIRILSEYEKKPVVFVSDIALGPWVEKEVQADESSWNGRLYYAVASKISDWITSGDNYKYEWPHNMRYVHTNVNNLFGCYPTIKDYFELYGFEIEIICPKGRPNQKTNFNKQDRELLKKSISYAKKYNMKPFEIKDMGSYLIVNMNGVYFDDSKFKIL